MTSRVTILGRGFGLYGYLPALIAHNITVILPLCYQEIILTRSDLCSYYDLIQWRTDHLTILHECDGVVMALPPKEQYLMLKQCLTYPNLIYFLLEKPLAPSPALAIELLNLLLLSQKKFRLGFNFRSTEWGKYLLRQGKGASTIAWNFHAHHYAQKKQTWKRHHHEGGGALRFYGIHVVALLAELGYNEVLFSGLYDQKQNDAVEWVAEFQGAEIENCRVQVSSHSQEASFHMTSGDYNCHLSEPFQTTQKHAFFDQRVPSLMENIIDLFTSNEIYYPWYLNVHNLWQKLEEFQ